MKTLDLIKKKILKINELTETVSEWRDKGYPIVFTNGCFDLLHYGHINYLAKAKDLGQKLIIGLNSDMSVKRLKGPSRPVNNEYARSFLLASLIFVDAVVVFEEDTPENIIKMIIPDILVKGGDYCLDNIVGADFVIEKGGLVEIIPLVEGYSTTNLLKNDTSAK